MIVASDSVRRWLGLETNTVVDDSERPLEWQFGLGLCLELDSVVVGAVAGAVYGGAGEERPSTGVAGVVVVVINFKSNKLVEAPEKADKGVNGVNGVIVGTAEFGRADCADCAD
jgi:hypothetical protein